MVKITVTGNLRAESICVHGFLDSAWLMKCTWVIDYMIGRTESQLFCFFLQSLNLRRKSCLIHVHCCLQAIELTEVGSHSMDCVAAILRYGPDLR